MRPPQSPSKSSRACSSFRLTKTAMQRHTVMVGMDTKDRAIDRGVGKGMPQSAAGITASNCQSQSQWSLALVSGIRRRRWEAWSNKHLSVRLSKSACDRLIANSWFLCPPANYLHIYGLLDGTVIITRVLIVRLHTTALHCTASPVHHFLARPEQLTRLPRPEGVRNAIAIVTDTGERTSGGRYWKRSIENL